MAKRLTSFQIEDGLLRQLRRLSSETQLSQGTIINHALSQLLSTKRAELPTESLLAMLQDISRILSDRIDQGDIVDRVILPNKHDEETE